MDPNVRAIYLGLLQHGLKIIKATERFDIVEVKMGKPAYYTLATERGIITARDVITAELRWIRK